MFVSFRLFGCKANCNVQFLKLHCLTLLRTGVTHNIPLLRDILTERRFVEGDINTKYLPEVTVSFYLNLYQ
jgi:hypothetical protein